MRSKLPADAFSYYAGLGPDRSYAAVAAFFKVDKTTVVRRAKEERWQDKLADAEKKAQETAQQKLVTSLEEMNTRHLRILRVVLGKAVESVRSMQLNTPADALRAIDICVRHERLIVGEPSERTAVSIEDTIRREYATWMKVVDAEEDDGTTSGTPALPRPRNEGT